MLERTTLDDHYEMQDCRARDNENINKQRTFRACLGNSLTNLTNERNERNKKGPTNERNELCRVGQDDDKDEGERDGGEDALGRVEGDNERGRLKPRPLV